MTLCWKDNRGGGKDGNAHTWVFAFRPVRSSVLPAGTAILLRVIVGQLALAAIAEAALVKMQLLARTSRSAAAGADTAADQTAPAEAKARRIGYDIYMIKTEQCIVAPEKTGVKYTRQRRSKRGMSYYLDGNIFFLVRYRRIPKSSIIWRRPGRSMFDVHNP